jgi:hypothetical protein
MKLPIFIENSKVPVWLSKISPIEIGAISLGFLVFSRGEMSSETKRHETIHYKQWVELGFVGFMVLYPLFWLVGYAKTKNGALAYYESPFEKEAYTCQYNKNYLKQRPLWAWRRYL